MASVVSNLVYRVSVSAIVGAIVAGGLIYLNNDRVVKSYRAEQVTQAEQQVNSNNALMEANENIASAIAAIDGQYDQIFIELSDAIATLNAKIDAMAAPEAADYSEITAAIADLNSGLSAQVESLEASISASQEQN